MAVLLRPVFGGGAIPQSDSAKAEIVKRREDAEALRAMLLSRQFTREAYGPDSMLQGSGARAEDLMPTTDVAVQQFGRGRYTLFDDMGRNVLEYGAAVENLIDLIESLELSILPGQKGNTQSEFAAEAFASMLENIEEIGVSFRNADKAFERGFSPLEVVYEEHTAGKAKGLVGAIKLIDRPLDWFGFDYLGRPRFKREYYDSRDLPVVPEWKVAFARSGSLHTRYGRGYGQDCYPYVWAIDAANKGYAAMMERAGFVPVIVKHPNSWGPNDRRLLVLKVAVAEQWKNALFVPADVEKEEVKVDTEGMRSAIESAGAMRIAYMREKISAIWMRVQGTMYSAGNQQEGSFARDQVADTGRLYKAPSYAAVKEAMINRNLIEPFMLVNFPQLERGLWPRASIDASFGEDLRLSLDAMKFGVEMGVPIAHITFYERTGLPAPAVGEDGQPVPLLKAPQPVAAPVDEDERRALDAVKEATIAMSEPGFSIALADGRSKWYPADVPVLTKNRGIVARAALLESGDFLVDDPATFRLRIA